jgi:hypothetical protein
MTDNAKTVLADMKRAFTLNHKDRSEYISPFRLGQWVDALAASEVRGEALDEALGRAFAVYPYVDESGKKVITLGAFAELQALRPSRHAALAAASNPFPRSEQIRLLGDATRHLLRDHNCDHDGYELWGAALAAAGGSR